MHTAHALRALLFASALAATPARAATVTITDCTGAPVAVFNGKTVVQSAGDDVVIRCALAPRPGTERIEVLAGSIVVDGANGGSVTVHGTSLALRMQAERTVEIRDAAVTGTNANGRAEILAVDGITVSAESTLSMGDKLALQCSGPACPISISGTTVSAHEIHVIANGTLTIGAPSGLTTHGPTDRLILRSEHGDVLFASLLPPAPTPTPGPVTGDFLHHAAMRLAREACQCVDPESRGPVTLATGVEGNLIIQAPNGKIDLRGVVAHAGEDIDIDALTDVAMANASMDNCGPKAGKFTVDAATCGVQSANLLDDAPDAEPTLRCTVSGTATMRGTCSARP